jgi:Eukaryotic translation initiation factor 3 subunit 7 (eIF-3)
MHLTPSQISSVGLQTGMTSLEITGRRHRALLQTLELALVVAGMEPRHLGVVFQALSPSGLRTNQVSLLSTTRPVLLVEVVPSQGVEVPTVAATLPITPVLLKEVAVEDSWPIAIQERGVGGKDGGIGKRSAISKCFPKYKCSILLKNNRTRESSVAIDPSWQMLEEIEFHRLAKLRLEVDEPEDL